MKIEPQAKLIAALAETMHDGMWASDILTRCAQIVEAVRQIERIAAQRSGGER
jgi:hypothetical protein